ncbi:hypothetical protein L914_11713 [Phytophthora nicotianae]|uniref:Uncharacterized protein n=1 Tax=Phytophthora nicotianae TaxID=4792 RepID=W2N469_PHYNI|nr:hypothetical protein L914_11713 [Phytophthora nicotianae]
MCALRRQRQHQSCHDFTGTAQRTYYRLDEPRPWMWFSIA